MVTVPAVTVPFMYPKTEQPAAPAPAPAVPSASQPPGTLAVPPAEPVTTAPNPIPGSCAIHVSDAADPDADAVLTLKSSAAACGIPAISVTGPAIPVANPVSPADTHDTGSAFGATHTAHRVCAVPSFRLIAACCHRFPALSVTLTAGSGMLPPAVSVFQPSVQVSHEPSCVLIGAVSIPDGADTEIHAVCSTDGNGHRLPRQPPGCHTPVGRPVLL